MQLGTKGGWGALKKGSPWHGDLVVVGWTSLLSCSQSSVWKNQSTLPKLSWAGSCSRLPWGTCSGHCGCGSSPVGSREGTPNDCQGTGERQSGLRCQTPSWLPRESSRLAWAAAVEMGEAFRVSPDRAASPSQAERGCAEGPGGAWFYSWSCHMLQVKVIMLGWIVLITKLVSVNSHSWLFWNNNS